MKRPVQHTHDHELSHSMVHYLLTIHKLKESKGYARVTDIAREMGLTKGSVSTALTNLKRKELVDEDESKFLSLSASGHEEVHAILSSRTLLYYFLKDVLGVGEDSARKDSCLMEHLMSKETRDKFFEYFKNIAEYTPKITSIDLSKYHSLDDFAEIQKGDTHLPEDGF